MESLSSYAAWLFATMFVLSIGLGAFVHRQIQNSRAEASAMVRDLDADYTDYYGEFARLSTVASRAANLLSPAQLAESTNALNQFLAELGAFKRSGSRIRDRIAGSAEASGSLQAGPFVKSTQALERQAESLIGYQIQQLARPKPSFQSDGDYMYRRLGLATSIINYNTLFTRQMFECETNFFTLKSDLQAQIPRTRHWWPPFKR